MAYRPAEAAMVLGVSKDTIERYIAKGLLRSVKIGSVRLIAASELEAFLHRAEADTA